MIPFLAGFGEDADLCIRAVRRGTQCDTAGHAHPPEELRQGLGSHSVLFSAYLPTDGLPLQGGVHEQAARIRLPPHPMAGMPQNVDQVRNQVHRRWLEGHITQKDDSIHASPSSVGELMRLLI